MLTTRTSSPYFSPNNAIAPSATAASGVISRVLDHGVLPDAGIDLGLDDFQIRLGNRRGLADVEAQPVGRIQAALLRHVRNPSRRRNASCSRCVALWWARIAERLVWSSSATTAAPNGHVASLHRADMGKQAARALLGVRDDDPQAVRPGDRAGIPHLAPAFGVERGLVQQHGDLVARFGPPARPLPPMTRPTICASAFSVV